MHLKISTFYYQSKSNNIIALIYRAIRPANHRHLDACLLKGASYWIWTIQIHHITWMNCTSAHLLCLWFLLLSLTLLRTVTPKDIIGKKESGRPTYSENIEGCFNTFSAEVDETMYDMNNLACQSRCIERGYILSATTAPSRCLCGNLYPSAFYRLDKIFCSNPCRPEHSQCFGFTCCGSTDGQNFTVSFSGKVDIVKQVLRRLSYDYRRDNMHFRSRIEGSFAHSTSLKAWRGRDKQEEALGFLSMLDGCPDDQWISWRTSCYKLYKGPFMDFHKASSTCEDEGATIVSPLSEEESQFIKNIYTGCHGWIGATPCGRAHHWQVAMFQKWESQKTTDECHTHNRKALAILSKEQPTWSACARLIGVNGTWSLSDCTQKYEKSQFVCEKPYFSLDVPKKICPPPWEIHAGICLLLSESNNATWFEARERCRFLGGHLVSILSKKKNQIVKELLGNHDGFIGLYQSTRKKWLWDSFTLSFDLDTEESTESPVCLEAAKNNWERIKCQTPGTRLVLCKARGKQCSCPLGWIQKACFCYHEELRTHVTWIQAKEICHSLDSEVVWISSNEENEFIQSRLSRHLLFNGTVRTFIQPNEGHRFQRELSEAETRNFHIFGKNCLRFHPRGSWQSVPCSSKPFASCSICKKLRGVPRPYLQQVDVSPQSKWALEVVEDPFRRPDMNACPECKLIRLQDVDSSLYIASEKDYGELYFTSSPGDGMCESTFILVVEDHSGRFTLLSYPHGAPLTYHQSKLMFDSARIGGPIYEDGTVVWFEVSLVFLQGFVM